MLRPPGTGIGEPQAHQGEGPVAVREDGRETVTAGEAMFFDSWRLDAVHRQDEVLLAEAELADFEVGFEAELDMLEPS